MKYLIGIMALIAVYGTLKQGESNYTIHLQPKTPKYKGYFQLKFQMYSNGYYPMLCKDITLHPIYLEIFDVTDEKLQDIDNLEEPYGYLREIIHLDEVDCDVIIYIFQGRPDFSKFQLVKSGNFKSTDDINSM